MTDFMLVREKIQMKQVCEQSAKLLAKETGYPYALAQILVGRGITSSSVCTKFFSPAINHFHDPFLFAQMERSVNRIVQAIERHERITIHGDYDVDGITATVLMLEVLRSLGAECDYFLPNRLTEGYGISRDGIDTIAKRGSTLIITVDCGISSVSEALYISEHGIDLIITDHHQPQKVLPSCYGLINPKIEGCKYPDKDLAGVGVALKLCQAMVSARGASQQVWQRHLDIVALGTAADIVPLVGENRIIARLGFEHLAHTSKIGLQKLMLLQSISGKSLSTADVVFLIAPCINAAGRLGDADSGVRLLLCQSESDAGRLARNLVSMNQQRRALDKHVQDEAITWVTDNANLSEDYALVAGKSNWHVGVIGIAASRLVERFCRPTFLFSVDEDGYARGSGRSVPGLHLLNALKQCGSLLESYGGHEAAAGAYMKVQHLPEFRIRFNEAVKSMIALEELVPKVFTDAVVTLPELSSQLHQFIKQMEPFGPGNPRPVFLSLNVRHLTSPRLVGSGHMKLTLTQAETAMDAIAFNFGTRFVEVAKTQNLSVAFTLEENTWNGQTTMQMKIKGMSTEPISELCLKIGVPLHSIQ